MVILLVDANLDGHAELLDRRLHTDTWREFRDSLDIHFVHFEAAGIDRTTKDDALWRLCQERGYYLLTANRNYDSEDSLEATICRERTDECLPVLTLADADRIYQVADYLDKVVEMLLDVLLNAASYRGSGRLYLP